MFVEEQGLDLIGKGELDECAGRCDVSGCVGEAWSSSRLPSAGRFLAKTSMVCRGSSPPATHLESPNTYRGIHIPYRVAWPGADPVDDDKGAFYIKDSEETENSLRISFSISWSACRTHRLRIPPPPQVAPAPRAPRASRDRLALAEGRRRPDVAAAGLDRANQLADDGAVRHADTRRRREPRVPGPCPSRRNLLH